MFHLAASIAVTGSLFLTSFAFGISRGMLGVLYLFSHSLIDYFRIDQDLTRLAMGIACYGICHLGLVLFPRYSLASVCSSILSATMHVLLWIHVVGAMQMIANLAASWAIEEGMDAYRYNRFIWWTHKDSRCASFSWPNNKRLCLSLSKKVIPVVLHLYPKLSHTFALGG